MATRYDVSTVPLQGGYVAKRCPVRAQWDEVRPAEPLPDSPVLERRFAKGRAFEASVLEELRALHPSAVTIEGGEPADKEAATRRAMQQRVPLILEGRLPADEAGRRLGKPDLLIAAAGSGYRAVDVKWHMALDPLEAPDTGAGQPARCASCEAPAYEDAAEDDGFEARKHKGDLLQLAHYQTMLEAAGLAAAGGRFAGVLGTERRIVWHDLDAEIWRTPSTSARTRLRSTMDVYRFEFDFRLDIIAVAQQQQADPSVSLLVVPVKISECEECPWRDWCLPQLRRGTGDVSLIPGNGWRQWKLLRDHGVVDRAGLAALDHRTARLVAAGVDVSGLLSLAASAEPHTPVSTLFSRRPAQVKALHAAGIQVAADAAALDARTAAIGGAGLPEQIDQARAALGPAAVYRRRGVDRIEVPRADVEVDVDMENVEEGVYLWGALVTRAGVQPEYHAFATWEPLNDEVEAKNSLEFWRWLMDLRASAHASGQTFAAYCYHEPAENRFLRKLDKVIGLEEEVNAFIASEEWVDLRKIFVEHLITGEGTGLKVVAPLAGHQWSVDDPSGAESMLYYDAAIGPPPQQEEPRKWLLTYNRGDVEATLAVRTWLEQNEFNAGVE